MKDKLSTTQKPHSRLNLLQAKLYQLVTFTAATPTPLDIQLDTLLQFQATLPLVMPLLQSTPTLPEATLPLPATSLVDQEFMFTQSVARPSLTLLACPHTPEATLPEDTLPATSLVDPVFIPIQSVARLLLTPLLCPPHTLLDMEMPATPLDMSLEDPVFIAIQSVARLLLTPPHTECSLDVYNTSISLDYS